MRGRPIKKGLDYYPLNVDFLQDIKIRKIMRGCGVQSIAILISLLSSIYRDEGYYVGWDNDMTFLVADEVGASEGAVLEVVNKAIQVGFFDKDIFEKHSVLTSRGIQNRFLEAVKRRKEIEVFREYLLINIINDNNKSINVNIKSINDSNKQQRKVKNSKVKDSNNMLQKDCNDIPDERKLKFDEESEEIRLARFMIDEMLRVKADSRVPSKDVESLQGWAQHIDYMIRLDKRTARNIAEVFRWAQEDSFWCSNIRSPRKLREQWDTLELQKNKRIKEPTKPTKKTRFHNFKQRTDNYSTDQIEDIARRKREEHLRRVQERAKGD